MGTEEPDVIDTISPAHLVQIRLASLDFAVRSQIGKTPEEILSAAKEFTNFVTGKEPV